MEHLLREDVGLMSYVSECMHLGSLDICHGADVSWLWSLCVSSLDKPWWPGYPPCRKNALCLCSCQYHHKNDIAITIVDWVEIHQALVTNMFFASVGLFSHAIYSSGDLHCRRCGPVEEQIARAKSSLLVENVLGVWNSAPTRWLN